MSNALFRLQLLMFVFVASVTLSSCAENDSAPQPECIGITSRSIDSTTFKVDDNGDSFTPHQLSILSRLEAINDSVAASSIEFVSPQSNDQQQRGLERGDNR